MIPKKRSGELDHFGEKQKKNKVKLYDDFKKARTDSWDNWVADCKQIAGGSK